MIPYLIPLIACICGIIFYDVRGRKRNAEWLYWSVYVYFVIFYGLRYHMGGDTILVYMPRYEMFPTFDNMEGLDHPNFADMNIGFKLLWLTLRSITSEYWLFQLVTSLFVNLVFMWFFWQHTTKKFTGLIIYYFCLSWYLNMEIARESYALSFFLLSYKPMVEHKWIKYYIGVSAAICFHSSAVILIIVPFLRALNLNFNKNFFIILGIFALTAVLLRPYLTSFISLLDGSVSAAKIAFYATQGATGGLNSNWMTGRLIVYLTLPLIYIIIYKFYFHEKIKYENLIVWFVLISSTIPVFWEISVRLTNYFRPFYLISMAVLIGNGISLKSHKKFVSYCILVCLLLSFTYERIMQATRDKYQDGSLYPYRSTIIYKLDPYMDSQRKY